MPKLLARKRREQNAVMCSYQDEHVVQTLNYKEYVMPPSYMQMTHQ